MQLVVIICIFYPVFVYFIRTIPLTPCPEFVNPHMQAAGTVIQVSQLYPFEFVTVTDIRWFVYCR